MFLVPSADVQAVISTDGTPIAGESFTLTCSIESLNIPTNIEWRDSDGIVVSTESNLQFLPLRLSHGEEYTCVASVGSPYEFISSTVQHTALVQSNNLLIIIMGHSWFSYCIRYCLHVIRILCMMLNMFLSPHSPGHCELP